MAFLVFGELRPQLLSMKYWTVGSSKNVIEGYLEHIGSQYEQAIDERIATITVVPGPTSPRKSPTTSLKRGRMSEAASPVISESKAAKNARLRRAMEEVGRTLGQMANGDLGPSVSSSA